MKSKKDYQNVIKGLGTYFSVENESSMLLKDIFRIALSYVRSLIKAHQQDIIITENIQSTLTVSNYYFLLTVISNIVLNAVEAIGNQKKGTITVVTQECDGSLKIIISDNGPGISDKIKEHIFKPGFSTKFDANGDIYRGIGLSNVKVIVQEQFHGDITCSDNTPKGAVFTISLNKQLLMTEVMK